MLRPPPAARDAGKRALRQLFELGQRAGLDVLPRHFYSEVPDIRRLRASTGWRRPYSLTAVQGTDLDDQLAWLRETCPPEITGAVPADLLERAARENGAPGYGPVEAELLYCFVRSRRPRRMVQIGAGFSTAIARRAAADAGHELHVTAVDPYPTAYLTDQASAGALDLVAAPVQELDPARLTDLGPGDVLFVDSTHTVTPGSDVNFVILEVLPRLRRGVLVHLHDIMLPYDYWPRILDRDLFFPMETVLLAAYLTDNPRFAIRLSGAMLHDGRRAEAQAILPSYHDPLPTTDGLAPRGSDGAFPSAIWLEVLADPAAPDVGPV